MELLLSNIIPGKYDSTKSSKEVFKNYIENVELLRLAVGYVSSDALIELKKIVEINKKPRIEMLIGMHYFDGFSKPQYQAALSLNKTLEESESGGFVNISNRVRFHGKIYSFVNNDIPLGCIVGSSNLNSIISNPNIYEADYHINERDASINVNNKLINIIRDLGTPISNVNIDAFNEYNDLLENQYKVEPVTNEELISLYKDSTNIEFNLPIKTKLKSNLNVFFGKGRVNQRGFEMPRPWYEVELIVPKQIRDLENYPLNKTFKVYTDDGWTFSCKTSGDFYKNFRSADDLLILGKWIKGRMEKNGALEIGQPVTQEVLNTYGASFVKLIKCNQPDTWLLEFKSNDFK